MPVIPAGFPGSPMPCAAFSIPPDNPGYKDVKHHVDMSKAILARPVSGRLFRKNVEIKAESVPGQDCETVFNRFR